ncbi:MAG: DUF3179 domain-containing protein [Chloroflexi bacterium]|nr:DUF3179 domain-containing protein [Chloroflexota bacterium]
MAAALLAVGYTAASPVQRPAAPPEATAAASGVGDVLATLLESGNFSRAGWRTDFSRHSVPLGELQSGGPPKDGIPPIDRPKFVAPSEAASWLQPQEPVVTLEIQGEARAYPIQVLVWHEIVNDAVGGVPVAVTFCPLCNTAIAFDRRLGDRVLDFGTTGNLRHSDLVMYDRQTESWWQQAVGQAIVGELTGERLTFLPAALISFQDFRTAYPNGKVLSRDTGHFRDYGRNPYVGYDDITSSPFLFSGKPDGRLRPMERVVTVSLGGIDRAYPLGVVQERRVVQDTIGDTRVVVFHAPGASSPLDGRVIADSRDIGAVGVFQAELEGRRLTFTVRSGMIVDRETASTWNILGHATAGPLAGKRLAPVLHGTPFWFAWAAFKPKTEIAQP